MIFPPEVPLPFPCQQGEPGWVTQVIQPDLLEDAPAHYRSAGLDDS